MLHENRLDKDFDWDLWLSEKEAFLKEQGYRKFIQNRFKNEDFAYWKKFDGYQVGVLFYDFRKYVSANENLNISIQYEAMLIDCDCRIDLSVSKDMLLTSFEAMAQDFYEAMHHYSK